jgi:hypothetical protein
VALGSDGGGKTMPAENDIVKVDSFHTKSRDQFKTPTPDRRTH